MNEGKAPACQRRGMDLFVAPCMSARLRSRSRRRGYRTRMAARMRPAAGGEPDPCPGSGRPPAVQPRPEPAGGRAEAKAADGDPPAHAAAGHDMTIALPHGVLFPRGVGVQVDEAAEKPLAVQTAASGSLQNQGSSTVDPVVPPASSASCAAATSSSAKRCPIPACTAPLSSIANSRAAPVARSSGAA